MLEIINVATGSKELGIFAWLAIGCVFLFEVLFARPISVASMNPALVTGNLTTLRIYILAPIAWAALAMLCWIYFLNNHHS
ncbi:hypothetical protein GCM10022289_01560 [Pedobacter jeongneungensis]|uniref:Aquaporin Z n=2 Tax=Pedobacter jeongneungensis TaxID=947309 RepID=A0ABP8B356_9SPHI